MAQHRLPYIDYLLSELDRQNSAVEKSFGRHVHWGYWERPDQATGDAEDYGRAAERLTLELCGLAGIVEGDRVLDAGCGFGGTVASLNERFARLRLVGLNIDERQLARARQLVRPLRDNTVEFCDGDACVLPFADASFDRVLAVECIFHFPSREAFFKEAHRVLRPGGTLSLSDFVPSPLFLPISALGTLSWLEKYNTYGRYDLQFMLARYRRLAAQTGFVVATERNITRHTLPTYRYLQTLVAPNGAADRSAGIIKFLIGMQRLWGALGLLNYTLLSFRKP
jgi:ubiquinone/menaquinone biosynthesis C-methylase UbiE